MYFHKKVLVIKEQSEVEVNLNVCIFTHVLLIDLVDTGLFNDKTQCSCYYEINIWKLYMMMICIRTLVLIIILTFLHYIFEKKCIFSHMCHILWTQDDEKQEKIKFVYKMFVIYNFLLKNSTF